jgi:hypothetical protein
MKDYLIHSVITDECEMVVSRTPCTSHVHFNNIIRDLMSRLDPFQDFPKRQVPFTSQR